MVKKLLSKGYLFLVLCFLYLPILLIIVFSFSGVSTFEFPKGLSLQSYIDMVTGDKASQLLEALKNTVVIAVISSVISTVLGSVASIGIFSMKRKTREIVEDINQLPIINSEIVMAISFLIFFATFAIPQSYVTLVIAHVAFCTPYVVLAVMPRLVAMDPNVYEAALDLGARPVKALVKVMLPIVSPGIVSGFVMALTISLDDFIITEINKPSTVETLSTFIYHDMRIKGMEPFWFAVFSIIFVFVLTALLLVNLYNVRQEKKQKEGGMAE